MGLALLVMVVCAVVIALVLQGWNVIGVGFMRAIEADPGCVDMRAAELRFGVLTLTRDEGDTSLKVTVELARTLSTDQREQHQPRRTPLIAVTATRTRKTRASDAPLELVLPGVLEAADHLAASILSRQWSVRIGWLDLGPTLRGFEASEVSDEALLRHLWPEHGERLRARLSARPTGLACVQVDALVTSAQWLVYPDHVVERTRNTEGRVMLLRALIAQVQPLDAQLRDGLATPRAIASGLIADERAMMPLRHAALQQLRAHEPDALDALFDTFWQNPTLRALEVWWAQDPARVKAAVEDTTHTTALLERLCPPGTYMSDRQRMVVAAVLAHSHGLEALWTHRHSALPLAILAALCDTPQDAREALVQTLVSRLRAEPHPDKQELLLSLPALGAGPALTTLGAADALWLERHMIATLRLALRNKPDDALADRAGHVLRFVGRGEGIAALRELITQAGPLQSKRKAMLEGHLSILTARYGDRINPGALSLAADPETHGGLTLSTDHGALSMLGEAEASDGDEVCP